MPTLYPCLGSAAVVLSRAPAPPLGAFEHYMKHRDTLQSAFPDLISYSRFVQLMPSTLIPLCVYLMGRRGQQSGISFIDATSIVVCHNRRIQSHKVFKGLARRGKTSTGWFYGFKLHLIINDRGELLAFQVTPANTDDRKPVSRLAKGLLGKLFGDKGYISQKLFETLMEQVKPFMTNLRISRKLNTLAIAVLPTLW